MKFSFDCFYIYQHVFRNIMKPFFIYHILTSQIVLHFCQVPLHSVDGRSLDTFYLAISTFSSRLHSVDFFGNFYQVESPLSGFEKVWNALLSIFFPIFSWTHLGLVSHICVLKNSSHFPSDAYMRHKSLYFSYRPRGRPTKQCQAKMSC